ncbi:hypothetical protein CHS0354_036778 [Potamilus streckersoni]|uniref:TIR domain-containing protein n=1 Tax=Potamilus streckersoni TaxID=2493646 RepID=A0AAE0S546_9BIVA|nr:hypothetical protein CHS0354_036778 [Potamilus streckersoni]
MGLRETILICITVGVTVVAVRVVQYIRSFLPSKGRNIRNRIQNQQNNRQIDNSGHHYAVLQGQRVTRHDVEIRFFTGIANCMKVLTPMQKEEFKRHARLDEFAEINNVKDVLLLLSNENIIQPGDYDKIIEWLKPDWFADHEVYRRIIALVRKLNQAIEDLQHGVNINAPYEYDALIIHTDNDREAAIHFRRHLQHDIGLSDVRAIIYEEFHSTMSEMRALESVFDRCRYIFIYVTENFTRDDVMRYFEEIILTDSLYDKKKNYRIIPVWSTKIRVRIIELNPLAGIKYWRFLEGERNINDLYVTQIRRVILDGREKYPDPLY